MDSNAHFFTAPVAQQRLASVLYMYSVHVMYMGMA